MQAAAHESDDVIETSKGECQLKDPGSIVSSGSWVQVGLDPQPKTVSMRFSLNDQSWWQQILVFFEFLWNEKFHLFEVWWSIAITPCAVSAVLLAYLLVYRKNCRKFPAFYFSGKVTTLVVNGVEMSAAATYGRPTDPHTGSPPPQRVHIVHVAPQPDHHHVPPGALSSMQLSFRPYL